MLCRNILIVGGAGAMGRWFTSFFLKNGIKVGIYDIDDRTPSIAEQLGADYVAEIKKASEYEVVLISVPITATVEVIKNVAPHLKEGSLLMDITTVKKAPVEAMKRFSPSGVEAIGTHPLFGPTVKGVEGQVIIFVPVRSKYWLPRLKSFFEQKGAHIEELSGEEHDQMMRVIQGLTHFSYISAGVTMKALNFDVAKSQKFMSPVYEIMVAFIGRILAQNPYLYAEIQTSFDMEEVHRKYIQECQQLIELVKQKNINGFVKKMRLAREHYGGTEAALRKTDKLINSKIKERRELLQAIGEKRAFKHIYSDVVHYGLVKKVTQSDIVLEKGKKLENLKIENVQMLSYDELRHWKIANLKHHSRHISIIFNKDVDPYVMRDIIAREEKIVSADILDIYKGIGEEKYSVTFNLHIMGDENPDEVQAKIEQLLRGLGGKIRGEETA
jgi:prephenate dehydrogenase